MLTFQQLINLRLGKLQTAVADWEKMLHKLRLLDTGAGGGVSAHKLRSAAHAANWKGENATVSKNFVTKTAGEFDDAVTEAESIHALLRDAYSAFAKHKTELNKAITDLAENNIHIDDNGKVSPSLSTEVGPQDDVPTTGELAEAESRIKRILWEAHEDDRITARALRAYAKRKYDFLSNSTKGLKDADMQQGRADAEAWARKIATSNVENWSEADLKRFNETLKNQRDNPEFAETLASTLGARDTLNFWHHLLTTPSAVSDAREEVMPQIQDNLSMTLALASKGHTPGMEDWKSDIVSLGSHRFSNASDPVGEYGFQLMSSLMKKGKYDTTFLDHYGNSLIKFERGYSPSADVLWGQTGNLDFKSTDPINDPVTGFMEALGHNPQASIKFFDQSTSQNGEEIGNFDYRNWRRAWRTSLARDRRRTLVGNIRSQDR